MAVLRKRYLAPAQYRQAQARQGLHGENGFDWGWSFRRGHSKIIAVHTNTVRGMSGSFLREIRPEALRQLRQARKVTVLTGAGMSAESGVPTFRDAQKGLWANYRPEDLATPAAFLARPDFVWRWYESRRRQLQRLQPNAGHQALAAWQLKNPKMTLITQNVDDLHERAGSTGVIHVHGTLNPVKCFDCGASYQLPPCSDEAENAAPDQEAEVPRCSRCKGLLRPGVVWFGEALPAAALHKAEQAATDCDLMLVVGTSGQVYPIASLPGMAHSAQVPVWIINPNASVLDDQASVLVRGTAAQVLPALFDRVS